MSSEAAVIIAALAAAIVGALVTALLAGRQLRRQLDHSRELADLAELRQLLDEAGQLAGEALRRTNRVYILLTEDASSDIDRSVIASADDEDVEDAVHSLRRLIEDHREAHAAFHEAAPAVYLMLHRILLRLDVDDPVTCAYSTLWAALGDFMNGLSRVGHEPPIPEPEALELDVLRASVSNAQYAFLGAAKEHVRVRIGGG